MKNAIKMLLKNRDDPMENILKHLFRHLRSVYLYSIVEINSGLILDSEMFRYNFLLKLFWIQRIEPDPSKIGSLYSFANSTLI